MAEPTPTHFLLERAQAGDPDALNDLYKRYETRVLAIVRARLGAELRRKLGSWDVVQEAFLASLKNVQTFGHSSEGAFLNWMAKIVENRIRDQIDHFRAARRDHRKETPLATSRSPDSSLPLDIPEEGAPSPSHFLSLSEDLARLERALDRLSAEVRELIVSVKLEGRSYQEVAEEQGKSADAVRMQVKRAMASLAKVFQELESEDRSHDQEQR